MTALNRAILARRPREYAGASPGVKRRGPIMLPAEEPIKTRAEVDFRFVSPAVFCADQE